jgi:hypothetical protein
MGPFFFLKPEVENGLTLVFLLFSCLLLLITGDLLIALSSRIVMGVMIAAFLSVTFLGIDMIDWLGTATGNGFKRIGRALCRFATG